jgi:hypothetical protein
MKSGATVKYLLAIMIALAPLTLNGQMRFGRIFGVNISEMTFNVNDISIEPASIAGIHFGGCMEFPLKWGFAFQPGASFSAKGTSYDIDSVTYLLSPIYIEIPVNLFYSFGGDEFRVSLYAGPYLAVGIDGMKIEGANPSRSIYYGSGEGKDINLFDLGLNFGAGVSYKGLMVSAQYGIGLVNIAPDSQPDIEMKNNVIGISIASFVTRRK